MVYNRNMKFSVLISFSAIVLLSACIGAGSQSPAPVTLYGQTQGGGSAGVHTVASGENLWSISNRYDIVMRDIVVANRLSAPFILVSGQRLELPPPRSYKVRRGDSLYTVSRLYEVSASELAQMNDLRAPYKIRSGDVLKLPSVTPQTQPSVMRTASFDASGEAQVFTSEGVPVAAVESEALDVPKSSVIEDVIGQKEDASNIKQTSLTSPKEKVRAKLPTNTPKRASSKFLKPVEGKIISAYGPKNDGLHNDGINIMAAKGTNVKAADNGVVVYAGNELKGSGNLVLVRHDGGWMTAYAHMDKITTSRGATIKRGESLGTVGATGSVDSPQLHFEVRRGTNAINPQKYLEG